MATNDGHASNDGLVHHLGLRRPRKPDSALHIVVVQAIVLRRWRFACDLSQPATWPRRVECAGCAHPVARACVAIWSRSALGGYRKSLKEKKLQGTAWIGRLTSDDTRGAATSYARSAATSYARTTGQRRRRPTHPSRWRATRDLHKYDRDRDQLCATAPSASARDQTCVRTERQPSLERLPMRGQIAGHPQPLTAVELARAGDRSEDPPGKVASRVRDRSATSYASEHPI